MKSVDIDFKVPGIPPIEAEETVEPIVETPSAEEPAKLVVEEPVGESAPVVGENPPAEEPPVAAEVGEEAIGVAIKQALGVDLSELEARMKELEELKANPASDEFVADDDFLKDFIRSYKNGGQDVALEYLRAATTDFSKMSSEEVVRYDISQKNPGAPQQVLDAEFRKAMREFGQSEDMNPDEESEFKTYLDYAASRMRKQHSEELKRFQVPERKPVEPKEAAPAVDPAEVKKYEMLVDSSPATLSVKKEGAVKFGDFSYKVDPNFVIGASKDTSTFFSNFITPDGGADLEKFYKAVAIASDPDGFVKAVSADAVAKAKVEWLKERKNPSADPPPAAPPNGEFSVRLMR